MATRLMATITGLVFAMLSVFSVIPTGGVLAVATAGAISLGTVEAQAAIVNDIVVRGNSRMDARTVKSFLTIKPGRNFTSADIDASVKALFATGLFADVSIYQSGRTLIVEVKENATINEVFFEGNKRLKDVSLAGTVRSKARGIYSEETMYSDVERIEAAYARVGRDDAVVSAEAVPLANNRVNVVFRINEGGKTKINSISFVGNSAFGETRLREVLSTKRTGLFSWLTNSDIYDPDRLAADEERLRQFYFNNGYADFQIVSSSAVLDETSSEYNITFTLDEGAKYHFGQINIESTVSGVVVDELYSVLKSQPGKMYRAKDVQDSVVALSETAAGNGYPFVEVTPRGNRDFNNATINVTYLVDQGERIYIERIEIVGNDRTRDYVIRREFDMSEGDALNKVMLQKSKRRLDALGIFETVEIAPRPGDSPDKVVVVVSVKEKASGELSAGGGYSTSSGLLGELSFSEKNFMGRGQFLRLSGNFGDQQRSYRLSFTEPYFLGYRMSAGFDLGRTEVGSSSSQNYSSTETFGGVNLGIPIADNAQLKLSYVYNNADTTIASSLLDANRAGLANGNNGTQGDTPGEITNAFVGAPLDWTRSGFGYNFIYNTLDNAITPRSGVHLNIGQTAYGAGGDARYLSSRVSATAYATLSEQADIVGMLRGRAGNITAFSDSGGYRALDNFFQGSKAIRGFEYNGFGPRDPSTGEALGGMNYWNATAEVNFPAPFLPETLGIRGAIFADAGALWGVDSKSKSLLASSADSALGSVNDNAMRAAVGASIIWNSPFGPLRFDYAEPIEQKPYDRTRQFFFGASTAF